MDKSKTSAQTQTATYERKVPIQPQTAVQGFGEVAEATGFNQAFESFAYNIAEQGSQKLAQIQGLQDAQEVKQGTARPLFPIDITKTDQAYKQAYNTEALTILADQGDQTLKAFSRQVLNAPTPDSLGDFEQTAKDQIDQIVARAPYDQRAKLKRLLENAYLNQYLQLQGMVDKSARNQRGELLKSTGNRRLDAMREKMLNQDELGAFDDLQVKFNQLEAQKALYEATGGLEGISPETYDAQRRNALDTYLISKYQAQWLEAQKEGQGDTYLAELQKNKPDDLDNREHALIIKGALAYRSSYNAALQGQQTIDYIGYQTKLDTGALTQADIIEAKDKLSPQQMAKLEHDYAVQVFRKKNDEALFNYYSQNYNNPMVMSAISGTADMDKVFEKNIEMISLAKQQRGESPEVSLPEQAQLAKTIEASVPAFAKRLSAEMKSRRPESALQAAKLYETLARSNPYAIQQVDSKAQAVGDRLLSSMGAGSDLPSAHQEAQKLLDPLTARELEDLKVLYPDALKKAKIEDFADRQTYAMSAMNLNAGFFGRLFGGEKLEAPIGFTSQFFTRLQQNFEVSKGDLDLAKKLTAQELDRFWGIEEINGEKQYMYLGPRKFLGAQYNQAKVIEDLNTQMQTALAGGDNLGYTFKTELKDKKTMAVMQKGDETLKGTLSLQSDQYTNNPNPELFASYSILFLPENGLVPRTLTDKNGKQVRYKLSLKPALANAQAQIEELKRLNKENLEATKIEQQIQAVREQYGDRFRTD